MLSRTASDGALTALQLRLEQQRAAYHAAGHAVTAFALRQPVPSIALPEAGTPRCCELAASVLVEDPATAVCACIVLLAGLRAELRGCWPRATTSQLEAAAGADVRAARALLRRFDLPATLDAWTSTLLDDHWRAVQELAGVLRERRHLKGPHAEGIIGRALRVA